MEALLITTVVYAVLLLIVGKIVPGIEVDGIGPAFLAGLVMGVLNALLKPLMVILSLPLLVLTLGLFVFVLNAILLKVAAAIVPGFSIRGFGPALLGALLLGIFSLGMTVFW
ncbi:MAG TPA: phage holin family protein [Candidatus Krumholzibacteria bacterium]|nr:phage holin family protein [Candidatus Krumholzibacteria bacterium]